MSGAAFRIPPVLDRSGAPPRAVLLIGSCAVDPMFDHVVAHAPATRFRKITFNNAAILPPLAEAEARALDFQIVQLPLRTIMPEHLYFGVGDEAEATALFEQSAALLELNLAEATAYHAHYGVTTYLLNFATPQQNALGRLQPAYSLRNPVHYVASLNRRLADAVAGRRGVHLIDIDQIAACLGRRFVQDDSVTHLNHGSTLDGIAIYGDDARIEPVGDAPALYSARVEDFDLAVYAEVLAAHRSVTQAGAVKLVIFDLDDTLWRGIAAERMDELDHHMTEGWPIGILEAATYLAMRGIMLAIVSKNDEANAVAAWQRLNQHRLPIERFAIRRINWRPKAENIAEIIAAVNVSPDAVLFVDDNPLERAQVRAAFPGIRTLDAPVAEWRRILLWSPELQPATLTAEGAARAATIAAKEARDRSATTLDRAAFLRDLGLSVRVHAVRDAGDPRYPRCLELLNKTNQFNTTGRRWTDAGIAQLFADGGALLTLSVADRHADYGLTCIAVIQGSLLVQYVMSCRVFGMGLEDAAVALAVGALRDGGAQAIHAAIRPTGRNHLAHGLYARLGFAGEGEAFVLAPGVVPAVPAHVALVDDDGGAAD